MEAVLDDKEIGKRILLSVDPKITEKHHYFNHDGNINNFFFICH